MGPWSQPFHFKHAGLIHDSSASWHDSSTKKLRFLQKKLFNHIISQCGGHGKLFMVTFSSQYLLQCCLLRAGVGDPWGLAKIWWNSFLHNGVPSSLLRDATRLRILHLPRLIPITGNHWTSVSWLGNGFSFGNTWKKPESFQWKGATIRWMNDDDDDDDDDDIASYTQLFMWFWGS